MITTSQSQSQQHRERDRYRCNQPTKANQHLGSAMQSKEDVEKRKLFNTNCTFVFVRDFPGQGNEDTERRNERTRLRQFIDGILLFPHPLFLLVLPSEANLSLLYHLPRYPRNLDFSQDLLSTMPQQPRSVAGALCLWHQSRFQPAGRTKTPPESNN